MMEGLLTQEEREKLGTFEEGNRGDYHEMLHYLDTLLDEGLKNGRFTREEVEQFLGVSIQAEKIRHDGRLEPWTWTVSVDEGKCRSRA